MQIAKNARARIPGDFSYRTGDDAFNAGEKLGFLRIAIAVLRRRQKKSSDIWAFQDLSEIQ